MQTGQPALLYLVPCTVLTTLVIAWARHEVKHLWNGHRGGVRRPQNTSDEKDESVDSDSENPPNTIQQQTDVRLDSSSESLLVSEDKKETQPLVKDD
uniref:Signal peptide peptidase-like 2A-like n=1 Tax=Saccoglossus kowalevskii TaxID=10224 RepID=A0ABM0M786_SACKO|nr:PREDICTED: signal peptide peptidase-like 2A-like [Saccoglossus kowalevskii]